MGNLETIVLSRSRVNHPALLWQGARTCIMQHATAAWLQCSEQKKKAENASKWHLNRHVYVPR